MGKLPRRLPVETIQGGRRDAVYKPASYGVVDGSIAHAGCRDCGGPATWAVVRVVVERDSHDRLRRREGGAAGRRRESRVGGARGTVGRRSYSGQAQAGVECEGGDRGGEGGRRPGEVEAGRRIAQPDSRRAGRSAGAGGGCKFQGRCSGDFDAKRTLRRPGTSRRRPPRSTAVWWSSTPSSRSSAWK